MSRSKNANGLFTASRKYVEESVDVVVKGRDG